MTQKKSYSRYFIILQEDEKGYALASDKLPSGYAKLEIKNDKCKISYYIQNLKKEEAPYHMLLICSKKDAKKIIKIGAINIDDYGRAEASYEYPMDNIANCGISIDKIGGAALVKFLNSNIIPVMSGFTSTDIPNWKSYTIIEGADRKSEEKENESKNIFDKYEEIIENTRERAEDVKASEASAPENTDNPADRALKNDENIPKDLNKGEDSNRLEDTPLDLNKNADSNIETGITPDSEIKEDIERAERIDDTFEDTENKDAQGIVGEEAELDNDSGDVQVQEEHRVDNESVESDIRISDEPESEEKAEDLPLPKDSKQGDEEEGWRPPQEYKEDRKDKKDKCKKEYPKGQVGKYFLTVSEKFEEIDDICPEIKRCRWYKVPIGRMEDFSDMSNYDRYTIAYYPMVSYYPYIRKYGHYVLGYKCDSSGNMKYLVYGLPGKKCKMEQPYGGRSGFVTWAPLKVGEEDQESLGYWLMFYDFRNSTIVIPVK